MHIRAWSSFLPSIRRFAASIAVAPFCQNLRAFEGPTCLWILVCTHPHALRMLSKRSSTSCNQPDDAVEHASKASAIVQGNCTYSQKTPVPGLDGCLHAHALPGCLTSKQAPVMQPCQMVLCHSCLRRLRGPECSVSSPCMVWG